MSEVVCDGRRGVNTRTDFTGCVYAQVDNTHKIGSPYIHHKIKLFALTDRVKENTPAKKRLKERRKYKFSEVC